MKKLQDFFTSLLSEGTSVSSKRFSGIVTLLNVIVLAYITTIKKGETPEFMFDTLAMLAAAFLGLTSIERIFVKKKEE